MDSSEEQGTSKEKIQCSYKKTNKKIIDPDIVLLVF